MPHVKKRCKAGMTVMYEYYYTVRYNAGCGMGRTKVNRTKESQKKVNKRKATMECTRIINANFHPDDLYVTFTYKIENRPEEEKLKKDVRNLLIKLRTSAKKSGKELKYIWAAEVGKRGANHIHMVINQMDIKILRKLWTYGYVHITPLDDTGQYQALAEYLVKYSNSTEDAVGHTIGKRYNTSRNLIRPIPVREIMKRKIPKTIRVPMGYYLDKRSERRGIHEETGYEYLSYTLVKLPERRIS